MSDSKPVINEADLIRKIQASDAQAFKRLAEIYYDAMYRFLWRKTRQEDASQDLVQELFLNLWKARTRLQPEKPIKAFLYRAANNLAIDHLRKKVNRQKHFSEELEFEPVVQDGAQERLRDSIDAALAELPEPQRIVFMMNRHEGLKYREIAEMLEISVKTVESRMSKALRFLRENLKHLLSGLLLFEVIRLLCFLT